MKAKKITKERNKSIFWIKKGVKTKMPFCSDTVEKMLKMYSDIYDTVPGDEFLIFTSEFEIVPKFIYLAVVSDVDSSGKISFIFIDVTDKDNHEDDEDDEEEF